MDFLVNFKVNGKIYLKDPESSAIGKEIVKKSIDLIYKLGFEQFTIKKLATEINTTEATIYRYFESKHRILLYILNWYWSYMEFLLLFKLQNVKQPKDKLKIIVDLLTNELPASSGLYDYDKSALNQVVIAESSKVYLIKEVAEINRDEAFKPYKDLCGKISEVIKEYNPHYKYPKSLSTTLIEASHQQQFFSINLPRLTDNKSKNNAEFTSQFILDMLFRVLG
ncbi:TetR/AcrR family transcriptional regulator [Longitalea luteola]|uniref:TetR/AcrR family transcriptional regulator n=1 Tax=Longitalea luteola TaxID=2812563 RepID=UPI001A95D645|nr:TetR/AcrR family transcriptional regulator [Longitalea luteola]